MRFEEHSKKAKESKRKQKRKRDSTGQFGLVMLLGNGDHFLRFGEPALKGVKRKRFLAEMSLETMKPYESPGEEWSEDEKEFLPVFVKSVGRDRLVLDLAGGYGRVTRLLMENRRQVILADLSIHSLKLAKSSLAGTVDFVRVDFLHFPFVENVFDGVWFTQAFEYVPPDFRETFLRNLNRILKRGSVVFINVAKVPNEVSRLSYLRNFVCWKLVKHQPVIWGEYIYKLKLAHYEGWHYHSLVHTRRIEKAFKRANFKILKSQNYHGGYLAYLLHT
jgi:ubiquinone/menaquinone biosynthesis C-methylase UbiE